MTAQMHEIIIYEGEEHGMASEPLEPYLESLKEKPLIESTSTACWRGYVGTWEVKDKKLYLIDLQVSTGGEEEEGMDYIFPGQKEVFAQWFSGSVRIPYGKLLKYIHMDYESIYEKDLYLDFEDGILTNAHTYENLVFDEED